MPSFDRPTDADISPSPWITRFAPLIAPGGTVLDLACGHGRHARYLAQRGFRVIAADIDTSGLSTDEPGITVVERDLEDGTWPWGPGSLEGVVVTNYLHRPHFPHIAASLAERGVLIFETFGAGNEKLGRPRNPAFLLQPGELLAAFDSLHVVAYEHGIEQRPRPAVRQRLCAVKGPGPVTLGVDAGG
jgi:SAM-dependent methyltransferase